MTTVNAPLRSRAGRNIGIEPGPVPFVQSSASPEQDVNPAVGSYTVVVECPPDTARTIQNETYSGLMANRTALNVEYTVYFQDEFGNRAALSAPRAVACTTGSVIQFEYGAESGTAVVTLAPGEKIVLLGEAPVP